MASLRNLNKTRPAIKSLLLLARSSESASSEILGVAPVLYKAHLHIEPLSTNLQYITKEKVPISKDSHKILSKNDEPRPLAMLYSWTLSKDRHVKKYAKFYTDRGIDVLRVKTLPYDLLFPRLGGQVVAGTVLDFLRNNSSFGPIFLHGFSVGAYAFGELMLKAEKDGCLDEIRSRFVGQIWDSAVDVHGLPEGLSRAFTSNYIIQNSLEKYFRWYMKANREEFTNHLERAASHIYRNTVGVPGLWIFSEADRVSPPDMNYGVYSRWIERGEPTFTHCFKASKHVSHHYLHSKEYEELMARMLEHVGMVPSSGKQHFVNAVRI